MGKDGKMFRQVFMTGVSLGANIAGIYLGEEGDKSKITAAVSF